MKEGGEAVYELQCLTAHSSLQVAGLEFKPHDMRWSQAVGAGSGSGLWERARAFHACTARQVYLDSRLGVSSRECTCAFNNVSANAQ
jgi:hypothetical protein